MSNVADAKAVALKQTLSITACIDLRKRERKYLLYSLVLWITCLAFIMSPAASSSDEIDSGFLERLFNEERFQWNIFGRVGDRYRSLLPELLYFDIRKQAQPVRDEMGRRLESTNFTGISIPDNSAPIAPEGGSSRGIFIENPTEEQVAYFERLNQIEHIFDSQEFPDLNEQIVDFYRHNFMLFEAPPGSLDNEESTSYGRLFEGDVCPDTNVEFYPPQDTPEEFRDRLEQIAEDLNNNRTFCSFHIDSRRAFEFFEGVGFADHQPFFQSLITDNRLLEQKYASAYVYAQVYEVPLLPFDLRRSWIVWLLPIALFFIVIYARSLSRIRRELVRDIRPSADSSDTEHIALLISGDRMSLRKYLGWSTGRFLESRENFRGVIVSVFALLLLFTPLVNIALFGPEFGVYSLDDAEGLVPLIYFIILYVVLFALLIVALVKNRRFLARLGGRTFLQLKQTIRRG